jgi:hypothetical protein
MINKKNLVIVKIVQGQLIADVIKSHLESEGIPVLLEYESAGIVYGITADGIGEVKILVPAEFAEEARAIIQPRDTEEPEE